MFGLTQGKGIKLKDSPTPTQNVTDVEILLPVITKYVKSGDRDAANSLFNILQERAMELKGKPLVVGVVAELAETLGHKIKAAQLYEIAGTAYIPKATYFLSKALTLYDESGEVTDSQRIEKKLRLHLGARGIKRE